MLEVAGVKSTAWLDDRAGTVKAEMATPFGLAEIVKADRETALAALGGGQLPAELYERSIIRTNVRLPKARDIDYLRVRLIHKSPDVGWPEIKSPHQKIVSQTRDALSLEVRRPAVPKPAARPASMTAANREFLLPNEYVQSDLPEIRRLAADVVAGEADVYRASLKLVRWVSDNMTFDLGIAFAPAGELIRNKRGTCVGYATLLATLARAAGIPSRVVMGYVYALGMFGGHAWTEVLAGGDWIPLDATIVSAGVADAARVAIASSSLADGVGGLTAGAAARLLGQVDLKVEAFALASSKAVEVAPEAKAYEMAGDVYRNPWLGFEVKLPAGFALAGADAVWPDPTVLTLKGPGGVKVEIQEYYLVPWKDFGASAVEFFLRSGVVGQPKKRAVGPFEAVTVAGARKAALALADAPAAWLVVVSGENAAAILDRVSGAISFRK
ncbi:MAG: transglutaminase domain-containing protein [Candidatus Aminicenantes bacterium]|nr:transglutaminase domain-containing protein [Candidatus Aminicenantes bacterium]